MTRHGPDASGERAFIDGWRRVTAVLLILVAGLCGCVSQGPAGLRRPEFPRDTLAITNETRWVYGTDPVTGRQRHEVRNPPPTYSLRCFVLARTVKQFHLHAEFAPERPRPDEAACRRLIREVVRRSPRTQSESGRRVVVPGYAGLNAFSAAWPKLFQEECGGAWQSYVQRGHWRMILPFSGGGQEREAAALVAGVRDRRMPVAHVVDFPGLRVNHAVVLMDAAESAGEIRFTAYDPNTPDRTVELRFDRMWRKFVMQPVPYFLGGEISVYEIYRRGLR